MVQLDADAVGLVLAAIATCLLAAFWARRTGWKLLYLTLILVALPFMVLVALALSAG